MNDVLGHTSRVRAAALSQLTAMGPSAGGTHGICVGKHGPAWAYSIVRPV